MKQYFDINFIYISQLYICIYVVLINCDDYTDDLSSIFTLDDGVFIPNEKNLMDIYKISDGEIENLSIEEIIIDKITKLTVDY